MNNYDEYDIDFMEYEERIMLKEQADLLLEEAYEIKINPTGSQKYVEIHTINTSIPIPTIIEEGIGKPTRRVFHYPHTRAQKHV